MSSSWLLIPILVPIIAGLEVLCVSKKKYEGAVAAFSVLATAVNLAVVILLFGKDGAVATQGSAFGLEFSLRLYHFSSFILLASAGFGLAVSLYSLPFMKGKNWINQYYSYFLLTL